MSDDLASDPGGKAAAIARGLKQALVRHPLRDNDVAPTLLPYSGGELIAMCDLHGCWADRYNVLRHAVTVLAPDEVALIVESFASLTPDLDSSDHPLSERFREGDPTVTEAIEVLRMTRNGGSKQMLLPYSYSGEAVVWGEAAQPGLPGNAPAGIREGDIADSLRAGFAAAGEPYETEDARAALEALGVRVRFTADPDPFLNVVPGDPCPCGSNLPYTDCHNPSLNVGAGDPCPCGSGRQYKDCHKD